jgi:hypothetical protein
MTPEVARARLSKPNGRAARRLSAAVTIEMLHRLRRPGLERSVRTALETGIPLSPTAIDGAWRLPRRDPRRRSSTRTATPKWKYADGSMCRFSSRMSGAMLATSGRRDKLDIRRGGTTMQIAFIGLGNMGAPMAANLGRRRAHA